MKTRAWTSAVAVLVLGCGGSSSHNPADASVDAPADAPILRTVSGTLDITFVNPAGDMVLPVDLSATPISALALPSFTEYSGSGAMDGTFSISNLPVGSFYLVLGTRYLEMSADSVDLSYSLVGRPDDRRATAPTDLTFNVTGLAAWQSTDELQMFSPGSATSAYGMESNAIAGAPQVAATSLSGFEYDLSTAYIPNLIDGSSGDQLTLTHLATQTDSVRVFRTAAETFVPDSFDVANGGTATLAGAFTPLTTTTSNVPWDRPAFAAELTAHSPGSQPTNFSTLAISTLPEAETRGFYTSEPDVLIFAPGYKTDSTAVSATWAYGEPFPSTWTEFAWCRYYTYRFIQLPGTTNTAIFGRLLAYRELSTVSDQAPLEPEVGMVVSPQINGKDAFGTALMTGVGTTPTLSWSPPTVGVASRYYVTVNSVLDQGGQTTLQETATIETALPQAAIPPGILTAGQTYVFEIGARSAPSIDLTATPNAYSFPEGWGTVTTTMVTP